MGIAFGDAFNRREAEANPRTQSYNVVLMTLAGDDEGIMTRRAFKTVAEFNGWYSGKMNDGSNMPVREFYDVVALGVSEKEAEFHISSPRNTEAIRRSGMRLISRALSDFTA